MKTIGIVIGTIGWFTGLILLIRLDMSWQAAAALAWALLLVDTGAYIKGRAVSDKANECKDWPANQFGNQTPVDKS